MDQQQRLTLTVPEVAELLGISRNACYQQIREKNIPSLKFGRTIRVPRAALEQLLDSAGKKETEN